jgi:hypothetical protein
VFFLRSPLCSLSASRRIWLLSFYQEKESNIVLLGEQKMNKTIFKTKKVTLDLRFATSRMLIVSYQDNMPKFLFT